MNDLTVVMPCYKEDVAVVTRLYNEIKKLGCEVIVVDDGGHMIFEEDVNFISYSPHEGYGYALKQGIRHASNKIVLTMDSDGEHRVEDVKKLYTVFKMITDCSMLVGCRWNKKENPIRWIGRKSINFLATLWSRHLLVDLNSGMRIFKRDLALGYEPILCDTFSYTTSITMAMVTDDHKVAWFPIDTNPRTVGKSHVKLLRDGLITVSYIFYIGAALRTRRIRRWIRNISGR